MFIVYPVASEETGSREWREGKEGRERKRVGEREKGERKEESG